MSVAMRLPATAFAILALVALAYGQLLQQPGQGAGAVAREPVTDLCLGCICEASSNCNRTLDCNGDVCGLFKITQPYWVDAQKPTLQLDNPADPQSWRRCVTDPVCAAQAVRNYMDRFAQDCNGDGRIDCTDYAAIHRLGGYGCRAPIEPEYWNRFSYCQQQVASLSPNIDVRQGILPPDAQARQ